MIIREKEILINNILLEMKKQEGLIDESIKGEILKSNFKNINEWITIFDSDKNFKQLNRLLKDLNATKENNPIVEIWDDFLLGHCHDFAMALNFVFNYRIGIIHGKSKGIFGEDLEHLFHAFAIDKNGQAYDVEGKYNYLAAKKKYEIMKNPKTGNIAEEVHLIYFENIADFNKNFELIELDEEFIIRAIKKISANPLNYCETKRVKSKIQLPDLEVNKNYMPSGDKYYNFKERNRIYEKFSIKFKKDLTNLGIWKANSVHSTFNGFVLEFGLGSYDFDIISIEFNISWKQDLNLSDEESENNIKSYFSNFSWDTIKDEVLKETKI